MEIVFFLSVAAILYVYAGYPLAVAVLARILNKRVRKKPFEPSVTVLIAAYNEKNDIEYTVRNKLDQDYPKDRLEIMVISDGSTDGTDEIVSNINDLRVRLLRQNPRAGKTSALNMAVPEASGEIVVFSDANSMYAADAVRNLAANFADPTVGYVTGKMIYTNPDGSPIGDGCTAYMKYENTVRALETRIGSVVGVDGGIDAVRKHLYQPMQADQLPDFVLPLQVVSQGFRVVYEPNALLKEPSLNEAQDEYRMRVRVSLRSLWALFAMRHLMGFGRDILYAWQLWSHKMLRYLCFVFLAAALASNVFLLNKGLFYQAAFLFQAVNYIAAIPIFAGKTGSLVSKMTAVPRYFVLLNVAAAHAFGKFVLGKKQAIWTPRKG